MKHIIVTASAALSLAACTTTGNVEKNAAIGAAGGAVAGAVIGNNVGDGDAKTGAIIGAVIGGAGGAYVGHEKDKRMDEKTDFKQPAQGQPLIYDQAAGRYYFVDDTTGKTYWRNGTLRTTPY
ncbi:MAG: glycine zipper 2TM domain-containing protein [Hellea sp.]|nr:glycine zipper 2TM domain-containing protein [Hellea sp.]